MHARRLFASTALLLFVSPALAVIKVDDTVKTFSQQSTTVCSAMVTDRADANAVLTLAPATAFKGSLRGQLRLQLDPALYRQVPPKAPVAFFLTTDPAGKTTGLVHVANQWLLAEAVGASGTAYRATQAVPQVAKAYPGRTQALIQLLTDLGEGKKGILDLVYHQSFRGPTFDLGALAVKNPTAFTGAYLRDNKHMDLLLLDDAGVHLFAQNDDTKYADATDAWGLNGLKARFAAFSDIRPITPPEPRPRLLLGHQRFSGTGTTFTPDPTPPHPALAPDDQILAFAYADALGHGSPDEVVLTKAGQLIIATTSKSAAEPITRRAFFTPDPANPPLAALFHRDFSDNGQLAVIVVTATGLTRYHVGTEKDVPPADFYALTGETLAAAKSLAPADPKKPFAGLTHALPFDYDGNGKTDLILMTDRGGLTLANRGYGAFLLNPLVHTTILKKLADKKADPKSTLLIPGPYPRGKHTRQNMLALTPEGHLYELDNAQR